jgi:hypothetical protein
VNTTEVMFGLHCTVLYTQHRIKGEEVMWMPRFDGTGPRGEGPMTGRGEGYCALVLPSQEGEGVPYGYAGLQGTPVHLKAPRAWPARWRPFADWTRAVAFRRGRGRGFNR